MCFSQYNNYLYFDKYLKNCNNNKFSFSDLTKTSDVFVKDLYLNFVKTNLLDKTYINEIVNIIKTAQQQKNTNTNKKLLDQYLINAQKKIEKLLYINIKGPINSSLLKLLNTKKDYNQLDPIEKKFVDRFRSFKNSFNSYCQHTNLFEYEFLNLLFDDIDVVCYMFINNIFTQTYNEQLFSVKQVDRGQGLFDDEIEEVGEFNKELPPFTINQETIKQTNSNLFENNIIVNNCALTKNKLFSFLLTDVRCTINLKLTTNLFNVKKKKINYFDLIKIFLKIKNFNLLGNSKIEWLNFFYKLHKNNSFYSFIKNINLTNKSLESEQLFILNQEIEFYMDEIKKITNKNNVNNLITTPMLVSLFLIVLNLAEQENLIELVTVKKTKTKQITYIKLHNDLQELTKLYFIDKKLDLPFLCEPKNYKFSQVNSNINKFDYKSGGYLTKELQYVNLVTRFTKDLEELQVGNNIAKEKYLNYMQKLPLRIDSTYLRFILNLKFDDIEDDYKKHICLKTYLKLKNVNHFEYTQNSENMKRFLLSIFIADLYQNFDIFFTNYFDRRHRFYLSGYPLNYQSDKLFRNLFLLKQQNYFSPLLGKHKKLQDTIYTDYLKKEKDPYHLWNIQHNNKNKVLFNYDANSSIFQIGGGLAMNKSILERTGIFDNQFSSDKKDIYSYIAEKLILELNYKLIFENYQNFYKLNLNKNTFYLLNDPYVFVNSIKDSINRKMVKSHLMPYSYNKSIITMIKTLKETILVEVYYLSKDLESQKWLNKIATHIIETLIKLFTDNFPSIVNLKTLFSHFSNLSTTLNNESFLSLNDFKDNYYGTKFPLIINNQNSEDFLNKHYWKKTIPIVFNKFLDKNEKYYFLKHKKELKNIKTLSFYQAYRKKNLIVYYKQVKGFRKKIYLNSFDTDELKFDLHKNRLGLYPNTTQFIDSLLLYGVSSYCYLKKIPMLAIHDSFASNFEYFEEIRKAYSYSYYEIIGNNGLQNLTYNFLYNHSINNLVFNSIIQFLSEKIKDKKMKCVLILDQNKIQSKKIIQEFFKIQKIFDLKNSSQEDIIEFKKLVKKIFKYLSLIIKEYLNILENKPFNFDELLLQNLVLTINYKILTN